MTNTNVEGIYPLTYLQNRLLIHGLSQVEEDQGFIQATCNIEGPLQLDILKLCWKTIIELHGAFRTSIHWEKIQKPVQVIHASAELKWQYLDMSGETKDDVMIKSFLDKDKERGFDFSKAPISRCGVIKLKKDQYLLVWTCHHLLFDGWSGKVAIQQVFDCYDCLVRNEHYRPGKIPDYKSYIDWIAKLDGNKAQKYWAEYLNKFEVPTLLGVADKEVSSGKRFNEQQLIISQPTYEALKQLLRQHRVTLSAFLNSTWGILLGSICHAEDVVFGTTVSGRSIGFPHIETMIGLFMNVLPVRIKLIPEQRFVEYMQLNQLQQVTSSEFEYVSEDSINSWTDWKSNKPLYDSLIVTQNQMISDIRSELFTITNAKGRVTTTHPLTIIAEPRESLRIVLRYDTDIVGTSLIQWISKSIMDVTTQIIERKQVTLAELKYFLERPPSTFNLINGHFPIEGSFQQKLNPNFAAPTNSPELELTKIWEEIIGKHPIGIEDNFFDIGGDSFMALQLISRIDRIMNRQVSPVTLIEHPTIKSIVNSWSNGSNPSHWSSLVPLRASGSKPPLFTIHGGGGHIFFYQPLARYLDPGQPVFALQPLGLDGKTDRHQSIEQMASHYLKVIKSVQPEGPFSILGTCLSDPICVEINNQMRQKGEAPIALVIVDSSPFHLFQRKRILTPKNVRIERFLERFRQSPYRAIRKMVIDRVNKLVSPVKVNLEEIKVQYGRDSHAKNLQEIRRQLQKLYYQYNWGPFKGKITLIKTTQNVERPNNWDEGVWARLASEKVDLLVIPGEHYTRFEEPDVIGMANQLQAYLDQLYQTHGLKI